MWVGVACGWSRLVLVSAEVLTAPTASSGGTKVLDSEMPLEMDEMGSEFVCARSERTTIWQPCERGDIAETRASDQGVCCARLGCVLARVLAPARCALGTHLVPHEALGLLAQGVHLGGESIRSIGQRVQRGEGARIPRLGDCAVVGRFRDGSGKVRIPRLGDCAVVAAEEGGVRKARSRGGGGRCVRGGANHSRHVRLVQHGRLDLQLAGQLLAR